MPKLKKQRVPLAGPEPIRFTAAQLEALQRMAAERGESLQAVVRAVVETGLAWGSPEKVKAIMAEAVADALKAIAPPAPALDPQGPPPKPPKPPKPPPKPPKEGNKASPEERAALATYVQSCGGQGPAAAALGVNQASVSRALRGLQAIPPAWRTPIGFAVVAAQPDLL